MDYMKAAAPYGVAILVGMIFSFYPEVKSLACTLAAVSGIGG